MSEQNQSTDLAGAVHVGEHVLFKSPHFCIEHAKGFRIAGLLFVMPTRPVYAITDMNKEELAALGPTLCLATQALERVLRPLNVYCAKFGESGSPLHFHVFARTQALTNAYLNDNPDEGIIDAPHVMSWANRKFSNEFGLSHGDIPSTIHALREYFSRVR